MSCMAGPDTAYCACRKGSGHNSGGLVGRCAVGCSTAELAARGHCAHCSEPPGSWAHPLSWLAIFNPEADRRRAHGLVFGAHSWDVPTVSAMPCGQSPYNHGAEAMSMLCSKAILLILHLWSQGLGSPAALIGDFAIVALWGGAVLLA